MVMDTGFLASQMEQPGSCVIRRCRSFEEERNTGSPHQQSSLYDAELASLSTVAPEEETTELHKQLRRLKQKHSMTVSAEVDHLQAENASLRQRLKDAHVSSTKARAAASVAVLELRTQNRHLLKTVKDLQEVNASLRQKQGSAEQAVQENVDLQRRHDEMSGQVMNLIDNVDNLTRQLSTERRRRADAEEQRCAQKELFHRLLSQIKHGMSQSKTQLASVFMKESLAHWSERQRSSAEEKPPRARNPNAPASELFAERRFKDEMAHTDADFTFKDVMANTDVPKSPSKFLLAEHRLHKAVPTPLRKPVSKRPDGHMTRGQQGCSASESTFTLHYLDNY